MLCRKTRRSHKILSVLLAVLVSLALSSATAEEQPMVPDWTLSDLNDEPINFYAHSAGRPAVLLFWATWCPYCRKLMPHLETLRAEFADQGINFYALNIWEDGDPVAHMKENAYGFHLLLKADDIAKLYGVKGTPGLIVVDKNHKALYVRKSGTSPTQVESDVRFVLGNAPK